MPTRSFWDAVLSGLTLWESVRDVNEPDDRGRTLLYVSARRRDVSFVTKALAQSSGDTVDITNRAGKSTDHVYQGPGNCYKYVTNALFTAPGRLQYGCDVSWRALCALYAAAMGGDPEILELLSKAGADVDKVDFYGKSPLWSAAYHGCASAVTRLLILGADVNKKDDEGVTPLIAAGAGEGRNGKSAVRQGVTNLLTHSDPSELLLDAEELVTGCTAVWAAAASGTTGVLLELIAAGADVNSNNKFGRSPLQAAAAGGHCETVLLLIAAGAELDACDDDGETALYAAAFENHPATVVALVSSGCCVDGGVVDDGGLSVTECPYEPISSETPNAMGSPSLTKKSSIGKTHGHSTPPPLVGACWRGNAAAVAALLADGPGEWPDLERVTDDGRTALTASCWRGHHHCVKLLLAAGAEVNHPDADGRTALWAAARAGDATSVKLCVERGGDVDQKDARRDAFSAGAGVATCTPLFAAVWQEEHDAVMALLRSGADPSVGDGEGRSPLSLVECGSADHSENTRRIRAALVNAVIQSEKIPETLLDGRAFRAKQAETQARRAQSWAEKRALRKITARELYVANDGLDAGGDLYDLSDLSGNESDAFDARDAEGAFDARDAQDAYGTTEVSRVNSSQVSRVNSSTPKADPPSIQLKSKENQARRSKKQRVAAWRGLRAIRNAVFVFRDAARAARDAERNATARILRSEVTGNGNALGDISNTDTGDKRNVALSKQSRPRRAQKKTPELSASEIAKLVKSADEKRGVVRALLKARASQIRSSLKDLPDALERIRACANAAAKEKEKERAVRTAQQSAISATGGPVAGTKPRRKSMWQRISFASNKIGAAGTVVTLADDDSEDDEG